MKQLYGITGKRKHGKDTLANIIVEKDPEFKIIHFVDRLKEVCGQVFGLTDAQMLDQVQKETPFLTPVAIDDSIEQLRAATSLDIQLHGCIASSPRQLMQYVGTEYIRAASSTYFIDCVRTRLEQCGDKVIIPSTRYPNEADFIRSQGGLIIKVVRPAMQQNDQEAGHASEKSIDEITPEIGVKNDEGEEGLKVFKTLATQLTDGTIMKYFNACTKLVLMVKAFNEEFVSWENETGFHANIGIRYRPETGQKVWEVLDVKEASLLPPSASMLQTAAQLLQEVHNHGFVDNAQGPSDSAPGKSQIISG